MPKKMSAKQTAVYQITVRGHIDADWSDYFNGLTITASQQNQYSMTTLSGELVDQAALIGVINNLYNLGYTLLSVEQQTLKNKENNYV